MLRVSSRRSYQYSDNSSFIALPRSFTRTNPCLSHNDPLRLKVSISYTNRYTFVIPFHGVYQQPTIILFVIATPILKPFFVTAAPSLIPDGVPEKIRTLWLEAEELVKKSTTSEHRDPITQFHRNQWPPHTFAAEVVLKVLTASYHTKLSSVIDSCRRQLSVFVI